MSDAARKMLGLGDGHITGRELGGAIVSEPVVVVPRLVRHYL
jgi:hypothetical protein